ncbi:MAG: hypothetical protein QM762_13890 [Chryseolinea sp.]
MERSRERERGQILLVRIAVLLIVAFVTIECSNDHVVKYPNPYLDGLRSNNVAQIQEIVKNIAPNSVSMMFDKRENELKTFGISGRVIRQSKMDSLNFVLRLMIRDDAPKNYLYRYFYRSEHKLVQERLEYMRVRWDVDSLPAPILQGTVVFSIDDDGRILDEVDEEAHTSITYNYDATGRLKTKIEASEIHSSIREWIYSYDERRLLTMSYVAGSDTIYRDFYSSSGLRDSTIDYNDGDTIYYRYTYNK